MLNRSLVNSVGFFLTFTFFRALWGIPVAISGWWFGNSVPKLSSCSTESLKRDQWVDFRQQVLMLRKTVAQTVAVIMILLFLTGKVCTVLADHRGAADVLHRHGLHRQAAVGGGPFLLHHSSSWTAEHNGEHEGWVFLDFLQIIQNGKTCKVV